MARARHLMLRAIRPSRRTERVPLDRADGRVLARPVRAGSPLPPFRSSAMDGYAVRARDTRTASPGHPVDLPVSGDSPAGARRRGRLGSGRARVIATGGPVPAGADSVAPVEDAVFNGRAVRLVRPVRRGSHVREAGEDAARGALVLEPGAVLRACHLALLAALGFRHVAVRAKPRVAVLPTGDEVASGRSRGRHGVGDANSAALAALLARAGCLPLRLRPVRDRFGETLARLRAAARAADAVVATGGVSMGRRDFVKPALARLGRVVFSGVAMKPGKPVTFGLIRRTPVFALPGNPGSAVVTFLEFVVPAVSRLGGVNGPPALTAVLEAPLRAHPTRRSYRWARARERGGALRARACGPEGSHRLLPAVSANALIVLSPGRVAARGRRVEVRWLP